MVGIVVVSHSRRLADAAVELALQMVRGTPPPIEVAAGLDGHVLGTDAARVKEAIDRVASPDGVLVIMDLGSAVLSAELALELRGDTGDCPIVLSDGPDRRRPRRRGRPRRRRRVVGRSRRRRRAGRTDQDQAARHRDARGGGPMATAPSAPVASIELTLHNDHGLHARPAARFVETVRRFDAEVSVRNLTTDGPGGERPQRQRTVHPRRADRRPDRGERLRSPSPRSARRDRRAGAAELRRTRDRRRRGARHERRRSDRGVARHRHRTQDLAAGRDPEPLETAPGTPAAETERLHAAIEAARAELSSTRDHVAGAAGEHEAEIFDAHLLLLDDDELVGTALELIAEDAVTAEHAWRVAVDALAARFAQLTDPYLRTRADDVRAVGDQVLAHLGRPRLRRPPTRSPASS